MRAMCWAVTIAWIGWTAVAAAGCDGTESTNPPGPSECSELEDCTSMAEALLAELAMPAANPAGRRRAGSSCVVREPAAAPDCLCHHVWGEEATPDPANDWVLGNRDDCDMFGRVPGSCAVPAAEFTGCDPAVTDSCEALCDRAEELWLADLAQTHEGEVRHAECRELEDRCRHVVRIDARCYVRLGPAVPSYDCSLSDAEILAMDEAATMP